MSCPILNRLVLLRFTDMGRTQTQEREAKRKQTERNEIRRLSHLRTQPKSSSRVAGAKRGPHPKTPAALYEAKRFRDKSRYSSMSTEEKRTRNARGYTLRKQRYEFREC